MQINSKAFGFAAAILAGAGWFLVMIFSLLTGVGETTLTTIGSYHPFFSYSWAGMIIIVIENLICGFIFGWIFAKVYNKLLIKA